MEGPTCIRGALPWVQSWFVFPHTCRSPQVALSAAVGLDWAFGLVCRLPLKEITREGSFFFGQGAWMCTVE